MCSLSENANSRRQPMQLDAIHDITRVTADAPAGETPTPIIDRQYFRIIYFREPREVPASGEQA
jgi:hypothetical protein